VSANDFISKDYAGFLGFETAIADMPTENLFFYGAITSAKCSCPTA
jgi:hypothetical protein